MQNKSAIWAFLILFSAACIYAISFTFKTASIDGNAEHFVQEKIDSVKLSNPALSIAEQDSLTAIFKDDYTKSVASEKFMWIWDYAEVRKKQINRGLDLQGGMNVTLEVSLVDLVRNLAANKDDKTFVAALAKAGEMQKTSTEDFVSLFGKAFTEIDPNAKLAAIFHSRDNKELFARDASNAEILAVIKDEATAAVSRTEQVLRKRIDNLGVVQPKVQRLESGRILVELPGVKEKERVRKILQGTALLEFWETYDNQEFFGYLSKANDILKSEQKILEDGTDSTGTVDSTITSASVDTTKKENSLEEKLKNESAASSADTSVGKTSGEKNPLFDVLGPSLTQDNKGIAKGPVVGYAFKKDTALVNSLLARPSVSGLFPRAKLLWSAKGVGDNKDVFQLFAIKVTNLEGKAPLEGDVVVDARQDYDQFGRPEVSVQMNADGSKRWKTLTGANVGNAVAIVLDNRVFSSPVVQGEIGGGRTSISGSFDVQEADDLASILKAGKLPAPSRIIEEAIVGPSLGKENIQSSFYSFLLALGIVLAYMIFYYSRAGVVANVSLLVNVFFIIGVLASIGATLTLPGIAGIVLTMGMALDANVLLFERIREEMRGGMSLKLAVQNAYSWKGALPSIIDSNVTSLFTAIILLVFATGPVQGFATTLLIGIITSMISAIFVSRLLIDWMINRKTDISFETSFSKNLLTGLNINFLGKRKVYYALSGVLILISIGSLVTKGLDLGVDFSGGRTFQVRFEQPVQSNVVADLLGDAFAENGTKSNPEVKTYGSSNQVLITTKYLINDNSDEATNLIDSKLKESLQTLNNPFEVVSSQKVGPTVADDIKSSSLIATLLALVMIFIYIVARFSKVQFGTGAIVALLHDVIIVLGVYSLFWGILPFSLEIDQAFIAAILTVVGYSINDTVIVFDRIREYLGIHRKDSQETVLNMALNSTLTRTINTSLTTIIVLLFIFLFGGSSIQGFVFAILIGVVVGTYSSLCIATPLTLDLDKGESMKADAIKAMDEAKAKKKKPQDTVTA